MSQKQKLLIYGNLRTIGFPGTAIASLIQIAQIQNPAYLLMKIEQEIHHLAYMKQLKAQVSTAEVFNLFNQKQN